MQARAKRKRTARNLKQCAQPSRKEKGGSHEPSLACFYQRVCGHSCRCGPNRRVCALARRRTDSIVARERRGGKGLDTATNSRRQAGLARNMDGQYGDAPRTAKETRFQGVLY